MVEFTNEQLAIRQWLSKPAPVVTACSCSGPQRGEPLCSCAMNYVELVNGIYYRIHEHRSPDGITHTAEHLVIPEEPEDLSKLSLKERLKRKHRPETV